MSKIAAALAKAKERTGTTTAPFITDQVAQRAALEKAKQESLRKANKRQHRWIVLLSIAAMLTAGLFWEKLKQPAVTPPQVIPEPAPVKEPEPEPVQPPPLNLPPRDGAAATMATPEPSSDLYLSVNELVISAVLPGEKPRIMHQGRIINVGEKISGELVFAGVQDGQIVFNDQRGAIYLLRY